MEYGCAANYNGLRTRAPYTEFPMRRLLLVFVTLFCCASQAAAVDLPPPEQLPLRLTLPDALMLFGGDEVTTLDIWQTRRAPELKELFQHYMYGRFPTAPENVSFTVVREQKDYFGGKATLREVDVSLGVVGAPTLHLLAFIPNNRQGAAPVFVGLNFAGNHTVLDDPQIPLSTVWVPARYPGVVNNRATEDSRGAQKDRWVIEQTIDRGYAVVTCYCGDIDPDMPDYSDGVHPFFKSNNDEPMARWGTIAAWAWGLSRLVDYVFTREEFDSGKIAAFGHSRLGKTALLAAAFDPRIALAIPHQAGCGGTSPSRGTVGESVERINTSFPHWFCGNFKAFNKEPARLPFDQHCLIALCAPRPVLLSNAVEDQWANPDGQFEMLLSASPVYRLHGDEGIVPADKPAVGTLLTKRLGYYIREGIHTVTPEDWTTFCNFADAHFGPPR